jgi:phosphohistidine phosphatase
MRLYLVRHAEAEEGVVDAQRQLTEQGRADARRLAEALRPLELRVAEVWHSGYPRAAQTAEPVAEALSAAVVKPQEGLTPFDRTRPIARAVNRHDGDLMIVGHQPFLGKLAARLVTGRASRPLLWLDKPGVVCLDDAGRGDWTLRWMLSRDVIVPAPGVQESPRNDDAAGALHDGPHDTDAHAT